MNIGLDNLNLDKLLQGRLFIIPDYQRTYSWETKQRKDLFADIEKLSELKGTDRRHFMSTIVCLKRPEKEEAGADELEVFYVVDGQQRLTTLIILLKALSIKMDSENDANQKESNKISELLVRENARLILLQSNHDNKGIFRDYLTKGRIPCKEDAETLADKNMIEAFSECKIFIDEWLKSDTISLLKLIKNRLEFIFYVLDDESAVYTTFEVLNSRGLEVDWLDKCKSMLMGIAFEKLQDGKKDCIDELRDCWSKIYRTIGLKKIQGQDILKFTVTLEDKDGGSKVSKPEKAIEFFRGICENDPKQVIDISYKLLKVTEHLENFVSDHRLKAVTHISHARLLGISIMLNESLSNIDKGNLLERWEKVTFRIFGLHRKDTRTKVGEYVRAARDIFNNGISAIEMLDKINEIGVEYPAEKAAEALSKINCYEGWENELIYFMYRYEEYLASQYGGSISKEEWTKVWNTSATTTIEHIHPQNLNDKWRGKFGIKEKYVEKQVQRLGNLIILPPGVNKKASDKSFLEKKKIYEDHRNLKLIDEILLNEDWDQSAMENCENCLIAWAAKEWE
jgi:hypothetical protein